MQVFEKEKDGAPCRCCAEEFGQIEHRLAAQLSGITDEWLDIGACAEVVADQVSHNVRLARCLQALAQDALKGRNQLVPDDRVCVVVVNAAPEDKDIAQQAVGQLLGFHPGATAVELNLDRLQIDPVLKFIEQPRLAQSRVADNDDRSALVVFHHPTENILQGAELALPADHARFHTLYPAPAGPERSSLTTQYAIDRHRLWKSLGHHRLFRFEVEHPTDMLIRMMRDQDGSRFGQTFQPGSQIDGQAGNRVFAFGAAADEHQASVDADPDLKPGKPALRFQLRGDLGRRCQNIETCQNGRIRIVFRGSSDSTNSNTVGSSAGASKYPTRCGLLPISISPASTRYVTGFPPL